MSPLWEGGSLPLLLPRQTLGLCVLQRSSKVREAKELALNICALLPLDAICIGPTKTEVRGMGSWFYQQDCDPSRLLILG